MLEFVALHADNVVAWVLGLLGLLLARYVWIKIRNEWTQGLLRRLYAEIVDAVLEVWQTYVSELKESSADGKLTPEERLEAKRRAIEIARANIGERGLRRLARVLGFTQLGGVIVETAAADDWLASKTETAVATLKSAGMMQAGRPPANPS